MKWRFRRRIKIAPGVSVNLSNSSAGVTVGGPAGRLSANTRGHVTAGQSIPGTGVYWQQRLSTGKGKKSQVVVKQRHGCLYYASMGLLAFLALGICGALANIFSNDTPASPERAAIVDVSQETPASTPAPSPVAELVEATATNAPPPVAEPVEATANTNANLREGPGTDYPVIGSTVAGQALQPVGRNSAGDWLQLATGAWIAVRLVDNPPADLPVTAVAAVLPGGNPTPVDAPSAPVAEPVEAQPTPTWRKTVNGIEFASDCPCDQGNILNCGDFGILMSAQACYLRCIDLVGFDVHDMDRDNDGSACEWNY